MLCTGWRRPIGCLELQVIFRKRATNNRALGGTWPIKIRHPMTLHHPVVSVLFAKEPLIIGLFCGKWPIEVRHPMTLHHPVVSVLLRKSTSMQRWRNVASHVDILEIQLAVKFTKKNDHSINDFQQSWYTFSDEKTSQNSARGEIHNTAS